MANTKIPVELSSTPGIVDNSNATAITIDSSERVGIGCTPTGFATEIQANSGGNALKLRGRSAGGNEGWLVWTDNSDNVEAAMYATADNLIFANTTSYTERMRIDSSGNVGIGTTSISATDWGSASKILQIAGTQPLLSLKDTDVTDGEFQIANSQQNLYFYDAAASATRMQINSSGQVLANPLGVTVPTFSFIGDTNTGMTRPTGDTLQFVTGGSERVRIASNGRTSIGTTTTNAGLTVANADIRCTGAAIANDANSISMSQESSGGVITARGPSTATRGTITLSVNKSNGSGALAVIKCDSNGDLLAPNLYASAASQNDVRYNPTSGLVFYNTSSRRYKENIQDIPDGILTKINQARAVTFDEIGTDVQSFGLIAEELDELIPELVTRKEVDGAIVPDGITYSMLSVYLLKAIQEQQTIIDDLKTRIEALEG